MVLPYSASGEAEMIMGVTNCSRQSNVPMSVAVPHWPRVPYGSRRGAETKRDVLMLFASGDLRVIRAQDDIDDDAVLGGP